MPPGPLPPHLRPVPQRIDAYGQLIDPRDPNMPPLMPRGQPRPVPVHLLPSAGQHMVPAGPRPQPGMPPQMVGGRPPPPPDSRYIVEEYPGGPRMIRGPPPPPGMQRVAMQGPPSGMQRVAIPGPPPDGMQRIPAPGMMGEEARRVYMPQGQPGMPPPPGYRPGPPPGMREVHPSHLPPHMQGQRMPGAYPGQPPMGRQGPHLINGGPQHPGSLMVRYPGQGLPPPGARVYHGLPPPQGNQMGPPPPGGMY